MSDPLREMVEREMRRFEFPEARRNGTDVVRVFDAVDVAVRLVREANRDRDSLWCDALTRTLDMQQIERVTAMFNERRPDAPSPAGEGKETT